MFPNAVPAKQVPAAGADSVVGQEATRPTQQQHVSKFGVARQLYAGAVAELEDAMKAIRSDIENDVDQSNRVRLFFCFFFFGCCQFLIRNEFCSTLGWFE
jgi:hypothetical protein